MVAYLAAKKTPPRTYFVLFVEETGAVELKQYEHLELAVGRLRERIGEPVTAFCFYGERWPIVKGPPRALLTPFSIRIPLVPPVDLTELDREDNFLGQAPVQPPIPTPEEAQQLEQLIQPDETEELDQEEDTDEPPP